MDTPIPDRIKHRASTIADHLAEALGDVTDVMHDLQEATSDVDPACTVQDFIHMVVEHIVDPRLREAARAAITHFSVEEIRKSGGIELDPAALYTGSFRAFPSMPRRAPEPPAPTEPTTRHARFKALYQQLLTDQGALPGTEQKWLLCQVSTRGGLKMMGALREHESGMLVMLVQGRGPDGQTAQVENYFDWSDLDSLGILKNEPTKLVG